MEIIGQRSNLLSKTEVKMGDLDELDFNPMFKALQVNHFKTRHIVFLFIYKTQDLMSNILFTLMH